MTKLTDLGGGMVNALATEEFIGDREIYDDVTVRIVYDPDPCSPREEFENLGTFAMYHKNLDYGDKKVFAWPEDLYAFLKHENCVCLSVFMNDHGSVSFSTAPFADSYDSGQVGVIYVTPQDIVKNFGKDTPETREKAKEILEHEIKDLSLYASGEVYGFVIETPRGVYDCCYSFYDRDTCVQEALFSYDDLCSSFATPEKALEYVQEDFRNYENIPMQCRDIETSKLYLASGGSIDNIPHDFISAVTLTDGSTFPS